MKRKVVWPREGCEHRRCSPNQDIIVGDAGVGKTSCIWRFMTDSLARAGQRVLDFEISVKVVYCRSHTIIFSICKVPGEEELRSRRQKYYLGIDDFAILFDLAGRPSFEHVPAWAEEIRAQSPGAQIIIAGNKSDLAQRVILPDEISLACKRIGACEFVLTSAKTGKGVGQLFQALAKSVMGPLPRDTSHAMHEVPL